MSTPNEDHTPTVRLVRLPDKTEVFHSVDVSARPYGPFVRFLIGLSWTLIVLGECVFLLFLLLLLVDVIKLWTRI